MVRKIILSTSIGCKNNKRQKNFQRVIFNKICQSATEKASHEQLETAHEVCNE